MAFLILYSAEAHPDRTRDPATYEERRELATRCARKYGINVTVLVDEMDNKVWCTYGRQPNNAYLIGTDGTVIERQLWYKPELMEEAIRDHLGKAS